jgi:hypothetical protein
VNEEGCMLVGAVGRTFVLRMEGRLTQKSIWNIASAIVRSEAQPELHDLLVDVSPCLYMDSTMLGSLARWALAFRQAHGLPPRLVGLRGGPLENIFTRMCLPRLFRVAPAGAVADVAALCPVSASAPPRDAERARGVLRAHETLAELSPENERAFALLIRLLRQQEEGA